MSPDIRILSVYDPDLDLFESQHIVPDGISYNSYLIIDSKTALMDTVDRRKATEWQENLLRELNGRDLDYLIAQHLEPDHSSQIEWVMDRFPNCTMITSTTAVRMIPSLFEHPFNNRTRAVTDGDTLDLGKHKLLFFTAPMVHWPEVIMTLDTTTGTLFSADGFGRFGKPDPAEPWACEARRYYFNIIGKYGAQVQSVLKKLSGHKINAIAPLHGPVLEGDLSEYLSLYDTWSKYDVETPGMFIAYASMHGLTAVAAKRLADKLRAMGAPKVTIADVSRHDMAESVEDAFRMSHLVVASPTYDGDLFPPMYDFIHHLALKGFRDRTVGIIENGLWAPAAGRKMRKMFEEMRNITIIDPIVTLHGRYTDTDDKFIMALATALTTE